MRSAASTAFTGVPPSQNTAPVHEFTCLYTHDLRRKQKRWQDGFLKFHTFNKRAMVYDDSRNHIGDTHWKEGDEIYEGAELTLENGVMVEVAERKSTTQTDLTPILQKRLRDAGAENGAQRNPRLPLPGVRSSGIRSSATSQPLHRPLSAVLGTPKGPIGKAQLPQRSPFEKRQANQAPNWAAMERAAKRQRVAEVGQTWNVAKDVRTPVPKSRAQPLCERSFGGRGAMAPPLERQTPSAQRHSRRTVPHEVVDITSDVEESMSDVTLPNTPPSHTLFHNRNPQRSMQAPIAKAATAVPERRPRTGFQERPRLARSPSPAVSTTSNVTGVQEATLLPQKAVRNVEKPSERRPPSPQRKTLKLKAGPRKRMLFCQEAPPQDRDTGVAMKNRSVSQPNGPNVQNSNAPGNVKRSSEIPKLDNGLTPSSPPEEVNEPPETAIDGRYRQKMRSIRASKSFSEREAELSDGLGMAHTVGRKGQWSTSDVASRAQIPRFHGPNAAPPAAAADKATSPTYKRRVRSENDWRSNQGKPSVAANLGAGGRAATKGTRNMFQRSASLQITVSSKATSRESTPPSPPIDKDVGPWSTEAMDLFDWRPPGYVFQGQGKSFLPAEAQAGDTTVK